MTRPPARSRLAPGLAAGLAAFVLGAVLALAVLPEWRAGRPADPALFAREARRIAESSGLRVLPGKPEVRLVTSANLGDVYRQLGKRAASWLEADRSGVQAQVRQAVRLAGFRSYQELRVEFTLDGRPLLVEWENLGSSPFQPTDRARLEQLSQRLAAALLRPGESARPALRGQLASSIPAWEMWDLNGSLPPQHVLIGLIPPAQVFASRVVGQASGNGPDQSFRQKLLSGLLVLPVVFAVLGIFLTLLLRARIDLVNGSLLALLALLSASPQWLLKYFSANSWFFAVGWLFSAPGLAAAILLAWSGGESLLRAVQPDFTTSLDTLRRGRLGPRGGRALLAGFASGAGLAGLTLAVYALAVLLPGVSPAGPSLLVPVFRINGSPLTNGISLAASVVLALALAVRLLPDRWAPWAAALLAGYALGPLALFPYPVELAANVAFAGLLIWVCRRFGLTALLAATVTCFLLPAVLFSARHLDWTPVSFALTAGLTEILLLLGFVGLARPETVETGILPPPPFMRRLTEERRVRHEVDLLARMQEGLLPREMPRVEGYQFAARSVLASEAGGDLYDFLRDEAGGLWIAAGDVAGHGYSCAVAQAMIKAGLLSLAEPGESPAGVLRRLGQVLRGVSTDHSFTSLALIRLDPETGEALFANAGHPYPMVMEPGRVIEIELPGLPLGRGPSQGYADRGFRLPRGSALVLCSDGLFEALDRNGNAYGFDRAREVVRAMGHRPAVEIVDALLNDCRRHLGAEAAPDDVTVVVVKRG